MSVKLTDAQLVMLSAAAQREDLCLTAPDKTRGARTLAKASEKACEPTSLVLKRFGAKAGMPVSWHQSRRRPESHSN